MLSDRDRQALADIVENIDLAFGFAKGLDEPSFTADVKTAYAVVRCLKTI